MQVAKYKDFHCLNFLKSANINQLSRYIQYTVMCILKMFR